MNIKTIFHKTCQPCSQPDCGCYACACADSALTQGVNAIALELDQLGIDCEVYQSGGFVMVIRIPLPGHVLLISAEGASLYTMEQDDNGEEGTEGILDFRDTNDSAVIANRIADYLKTL